MAYPSGPSTVASNVKSDDYRGEDLPALARVLPSILHRRHANCMQVSSKHAEYSDTQCSGGSTSDPQGEGGHRRLILVGLRSCRAGADRKAAHAPRVADAPSPERPGSPEPHGSRHHPRISRSRLSRTGRLSCSWSTLRRSWSCSWHRGPALPSKISYFRRMNPWRRRNSSISRYFTQFAGSIERASYHSSAPNRRWRISGICR